MRTRIGSILHFGVVGLGMLLLLLGLSTAIPATPVTSAGPESGLAAPAAAAWVVTGNAIVAGNFLGTTNNQSLVFKVNNQRGLLIQPNGTSPNFIGGHSANSVSAGAYGAAIGGGGTVNNANRVTDNYGTVGGGMNNRAGDGAGTTGDRQYAVVGGGNGNLASGQESTVGGGVGNNAQGARNTIGGGYVNLASNNASTVGGGANNTANGAYSFVGGGGGSTASGSNATVAGGNQNLASDQEATVGGGVQNKAQGARATVGGGYVNLASSNASTVGGGANNTASGGYSTVSGGARNTASGAAAIVAGGDWNTAEGDFSFVAGRRGRTTAAADGTFLFTDSQDFALNWASANQFVARVTGGVWFILGINASGVPTWTCRVVNGGAWTCSSDRNLKENLSRVDGRAILARLNEMPIYQWNAKGADPAVKHFGPTAQDFYAAFNIGEDDKSISTIDLDGVSLAAIQGLYQVVQAQDTRIAALAQESRGLQKQNAELEARVARQQEQIAALDARLAALEQGQRGLATTSTLDSLSFGGGLFFGAILIAGVMLRRRVR